MIQSYIHTFTPHTYVRRAKNHLNRANVWFTNESSLQRSDHKYSICEFIALPRSLHIFAIIIYLVLNFSPSGNRSIDARKNWYVCQKIVFIIIKKKWEFYSFNPICISSLANRRSDPHSIRTSSPHTQPKTYVLHMYATIAIHTLCHLVNAVVYAGPYSLQTLRKCHRNFMSRWRMGHQSRPEH